MPDSQPPSQPVDTGVWNIRLEFVCLARIGTYWNNRQLSGNYWRLYRNFSGGAGVFVDRRKVTIAPDNFYLLPPNCNLKTFCCDTGLQQLYLHFELPWCNCSRPICAVPAAPYLENLQQSLLNALEKNPSRIPIFAFALIGGALAGVPPGLLTERRYDYPIARVCEYLRSNLQDPLGVSDIIRVSQLPAGEFLRRFRDATGTTPYHYLTDLRYRRAEQLLAASELSIDEICEAVGVIDRFHFSRNFKQRYGQSPAAYRRRGAAAARFNH